MGGVLKTLFGITFSVVILSLTCPVWAAEPPPQFPLQEGDIWVMAGDSITAQHLHSNYFEAFCYARYPNLKFAFRNSGVGGHTIPSTLARFDYDIAAWTPTVVSVELGMNDKGGTTPDQFRANMKTMIERIRSIHARPVIFAPSPVNNGDTATKLGAGNLRLHQFCVELTGLCTDEKIPFADQFNRLVSVWGQNKPHEILANSLDALKQVSQDKSLAGIEHLRQFLAAQEQAQQKPISLQGDPVHPGPPGQLMMAAELLKQLGAQSLVSVADLDADGKLVEATACEISNIVAKDKTLTFDRLDERLPFPIPNECRSVLPLCPTILELSQYTLRVKNLPAGRYTLKINGISTATLTEQELTAGVNLTSFGPNPQEKTVNPIVAQGLAILNAVTAKEGFVSLWRGLSKRAHAPEAAPELKEQLAQLLAKVEEADAKIRAAAQPQKLHFEIAPASAETPKRLSLWNNYAPIGDGQFQAEDAFITVRQPAQPNGAAVVICPGGGYGGLVTGAEGHGIAAWLNEHGITGVVLEYRLPAGRSFVPLFDAQRAIRTVRANAKAWNIDPARIGIIGFSAGGHLASTAGTHFDEGNKASSNVLEQTSCRPDFTILVYPVVSLTQKFHSGSKQNLLGKDPSPQLVELFSNETQVTAKTPPTFLAHALDDTVVPADNSKMLFDALQAHKIPSKYLELPSGGHGLNGYKGPMWDAWQKQSLEFLHEQKLIPQI